MAENQRELFSDLKEEVRKVFQDHTGIDKPLSNWSSNDIAEFQEHLQQRVKGSVSEKWIYTHFKKEQEKLPRIDVLNLLSAYANRSSWEHFVQEKIPQKTRKKSLIVLAIISGIMGLFYLAFLNLKPEKGPIIILEDAYSGMEIDNSQMDFIGDGKVIRQRNGDWTVHENGRMQIFGWYYQMKEVNLQNAAFEDTIVIKMKPDDLAMMINYFANYDATDWKERASQLNGMIHEEAQIYQVHPLHNGLELLNKEEFVERLLLPKRFLKGLKIIDIEKKESKIYRLRYEHES